MEYKIKFLRAGLLMTTVVVVIFIFVNNRSLDLKSNYHLKRFGKKFNSNVYRMIHEKTNITREITAWKVERRRMNKTRESRNYVKHLARAKKPDAATLSNTLKQPNRVKMLLNKNRVPERKNSRRQKHIISSFHKEIRHLKILSTSKKNLFKEKGNIHSTITLARKADRKIRTCPRWKKEVSDWTLRYLDEVEYFHSGCLKPTIDSNTKRIIYKNGSAVYNGCTATTRECNEKAHYDFKTSQRINTPPCCRHHILSIFEKVTTELRKRNISHCLISGGVIGWMRDKKMVPYDRDLDLVVSNDFWNTTEFWSLLTKLKSDYGYEYNLVEDLKLKVYLSKRNSNGIDIWAYSTSKNVFDIEYFRFKKQQIATMIPFKEVTFEGCKTFIPNRPKEYLDKQYGKERWGMEKQCMVRDQEDNCW